LKVDLIANRSVNVKSNASGLKLGIYHFVQNNKTEDKKKHYLVLLLNVMMLNLQKRFHFRRGQRDYDIGYIFRSNKTQSDNHDICLVLNISIDKSEEKVYEINKPTATLFQSNDDIEEMIADEAVAFSLQYLHC